MIHTDKILFALLVVFAFQPQADAATNADFESTIQPLLQKHCVECHGASEQNGELRLDAKSLAMKGGYDGPAIVAGQPDQSPLFKRITSTGDDRMPPSDHVADSLTVDEIAAVKRWIEAGADWPENDAERAVMAAIEQAAASDERKQYWSVQPIRNDFASVTSVDHFIENKLRENGLKMSPPADARTLTRRLHFDLIGLPPTTVSGTGQMSDDDYELLVDQLLASPHYGQRWARHWLDIAHYADTHGFERDQLRPNAWRYRDYVIQSLNTGIAR